MHIIPVIDLKDGRAVAARQGKRQTYRPLTTPLCPQADVLAVIRAYLSVFPFRTFYIADLDAIENNGNNHTLISRLLETHSDLSLWVDSGLDPFIDANSSLFRARVSNVLGSETGITPEQLEHYTRKSDCILSLDYTDRRLLGNTDLLGQPRLLPQRVIIMCLGRVGCRTGPDLEHISELVGKLQDRQLYAAGGVRDADDLRLLAEQGVHGALLASALHNGSLTAEHLCAL